MQFGRTPAQKRKTSGLYNLGYPKDLTQDLDRLRQLKANATAMPEVTDSLNGFRGFHGFGSFEYVDLDPISGNEARRFWFGDVSEVSYAASIKSMTGDANINDDDGTLDLRTQMMQSLIGLINIAGQWKTYFAALGQRFEAAVAKFTEAIAKFTEARKYLLSFHWLDTKRSARAGLQRYVEARVAGKEELGRDVSAEQRRLFEAEEKANVDSWTTAQIKLIQTALARIGYYTRAIDGILGAGTIAALDRLMSWWRHQTPEQIQAAAASLPAAKTGAGGTKPTPVKPTPTPVALPKSSGAGTVIGIALASAAAIGIFAYLATRKSDGPRKFARVGA